MKAKARKKGFTLIELLVVIAVIAILMGILLPVLSRVKEKGKEARARAEIHSLMNAIKFYESTYGVLPWSGADKTFAPVAKSTLAGSVDYNVLIEYLTGVDGPGSNTFKTNTRGVKFLETSGSYATDGFVDPWGFSYGVALDLDYDGKVTIASSDKANGVEVNSSVAVYSLGTGSSTTSSTKYLYSWK